MWMRDGRLLIHKQGGTVGFLVSYMANNDIARDELVFRPPSATISGCSRGTWPPEYRLYKGTLNITGRF